MARIQPLLSEETSGDVRAALEAGERRRGYPSVGAGIRAYCPPVFEAAAALTSAPDKSGLLDAQLRNLLCLRVALILGCPV